jgi:hypothetical protein
MEEGCNWSKREKRDMYTIDTINDVRLYAEHINSAARDIDDSYIESTRRKHEHI